MNRTVKSEVNQSKNEPLIFEIKGNSLDDGPGIRTVVFFKGCPLSCVWCHNPESKRRERELSYDKKKCVGCDTCVGACPEKALDRGLPGFVNRERCSLCLKCAEVCPSGALSAVGNRMSVDEIVREIEKDVPFFENSGGGVTLSGGEPTLFMDFASRLAARLKKRGVSVLLETCGFFNCDTFMKMLYPHLDMIYFDIKLFDGAEHLRLCGRPNDVILANFAKLYRKYRQGGTEVLPRVPLIPDCTATEENLSAIADFLRKLGVKKIGLLQNNPLWFEKNEMLGRSTDIETGSMRAWIDREKMERIRSLFKGIEIV
ncbi:MAG: glycyl-radical enzyme activating protein [Spirochaetes bacterium]|nr:glycyl-radical enzyme activating protein [Spirochaetota bacterium]